MFQRPDDTVAGRGALRLTCLILTPRARMGKHAHSKPTVNGPRAVTDCLKMTIETGWPNSVARPRGHNALENFGSSITRSASLQTYLVIRFLSDRALRDDAFRAYAYFRWLDDALDQSSLDQAARIALCDRQVALANCCYQRDWPITASREEGLLVDLIRHHPEPCGGQFTYVHRMFAVMSFVARRHWRPGQRSASCAARSSGDRRREEPAARWPLRLLRA